MSFESLAEVDTPNSRHEKRWNSPDYDMQIWANYSKLIEASLRKDDPQILDWYNDTANYLTQIFDLGATLIKPESFDFAVKHAVMRVCEFNDTEEEREANYKHYLKEVKRLQKMEKLDPDVSHAYFCDAIEYMFDLPPHGLSITVEDFRHRLLLVTNPVVSKRLYDRIP